MSRPSLLAGLLLCGGLAAQEPDAAPPVEPPTAETGEAPLSERHRRFLEETALLLHEDEKSAFEALRRDYQRDRFIERFWSERDPFPRSPRNELRDRWDENLEVARDRFGDLADPRAQMVLLFGAERRSYRVSCGDLLVPLEIMHFDEVAGVRPEFFLVFQRLGGNRVREWNPRDGLSALGAGGSLRLQDRGAVVDALHRECTRGGDVVNALLSAVYWRDLADALLPGYDAPPEWVQSFVSRSTDVPDDAQSLPAEVSWHFPGAYQSRTVVQLVMSVDRSAATLGHLGERRSYNFIVDGEVLRGGEFFESFRYKFDMPVPENEGEVPTRELPVAIQRYLRPDTYTWVVKLEDLNAEAFFRSEMDVTVPNVRLQPSTDVAESGTGEPIGELEIWDEANASIADGPTGEHTILLRGPASERLLTGAIRVEAQATGEGIEKVAFQLNGKPLLSKRRAPYSVEISLGTAPQLHSLVALALGADNRQLARDELLLNAGPNRFAVRLVEPQRGHRYSRSVRARAEVDLPSTEVLDRVDLFLNEDLVATLYQEPFVQPILIPEGQDLGFVRAVAYLATGTSTEDLVFVNSPHPIANVDVNFVELYASIFDSRGRPVEDVDVSELRVLEDGEEQNVRRFTTVDERAIHAGILLDTSSSMEGSMEEAEDAALQFFESVVEDRDRACLINFADQPELVVPFTNDVSVLAGGLAGLVADGETTLHDSLIFALHYFNGLRGKRALVLISDGEDSSSEYRYEDVLEFARRSGVAVYAVGLRISNQEIGARQKLSRLASETGGQSYFIESAKELRSVYEKVERELRSQYLITYQSESRAPEDHYREIEVKVSRKGVKAKTMRGYYP